MKIKSTVAEATRYGSDALEAFYTAVENGQARLALLILVDVIKAFEEKIDELVEADASTEVKSESEKPAASTKEDVKSEESKVSKSKNSEKEITDNN